MREELWKKIGNVSLDEAIGLVVRNRTRYGRLVASQSPLREARESAANKAVLQEHLAAVERQLERTGERSGDVNAAQKLAALSHQREILTAMMEYGNRKLHATELAAALVLTHGLEEKKLRPVFNAAICLSRRANPPFSGKLNHVVARGLKGNVFQQVHDALESRPGYYATAVDLARELKVKPVAVEIASGVLDLAGVVHKLPTDSRKSSFVWMHASGTPPEPTWNGLYTVLLALSRSPVPLNITDLAESEHNSLFLSTRAIGLLLSKAQREGLVDVVAGAYRKRHGVFLPFFIKSTIKEAILETHNSGKLIESLRPVLLGSFEPDRVKVSQVQETRLVKYVQFLMAMAVGSPQISAVAERIGLNTTTAYNYARGGVPVHFKQLGFSGTATLLEKLGKREEAEFIRRRN
ncbi:MAG: hypothetical protein V1722_05040 [Candidatus Micrarchaeota archaeon]